MNACTVGSLHEKTKTPPAIRPLVPFIRAPESMPVGRAYAPPTSSLHSTVLVTPGVPLALILSVYVYKQLSASDVGAITSAVAVGYGLGLCVCVRVICLFIVGEGSP